MAWYAESGQTVLNKAIVQRYVAELNAEGKSAANVNQRLSAVRKLASEAADNDLLSEQSANGITRVKGVSQRGHRVGNWLAKDTAQDLLDAPNTAKLKGIRDRAILSLLIGTGVRRSEAASLTFSHVQQREGRWVIVDLVGKGGKVRTVPMPSWTKAAVDSWAAAADLSEGRIFRSMNKGGRIVGESLTGQAIDDVVKLYTHKAGLEGIACHDLRRTFAKLAHKGDAPLEQIQLSLGHASLKTTELYLGIEQDFADAPCDRLGLRLAEKES